MTDFSKNNKTKGEVMHQVVYMFSLEGGITEHVNILFCTWLYLNLDRKNLHCFIIRKVKYFHYETEIKLNCIAAGVY